MFERYDFIPDFVLPNPQGERVRFYGAAGGTRMLLAIVPSIAGESFEAQLTETVALAEEVGLDVTFIVGNASVADSTPGRIFVDPGNGLRARWKLGSGPRLFLLSENLRVAHAFDPESPDGWPTALRTCLDGSDPDSKTQGIPAPVLLIPNALDHDFCDRLMSVWDTDGNQETGVELSYGGGRSETQSAQLKRRWDHTVNDAALMQEITNRVARRVGVEGRVYQHLVVEELVALRELHHAVQDQHPSEVGVLQDLDFLVRGRLAVERRHAGIGVDDWGEGVALQEVHGRSRAQVRTTGGTGVPLKGEAYAVV